MACRGVYFALTPEENRRVLLAESHLELVDIIQEEIEERWDREWLCEVDKAWDAIHRCLTDGTLQSRGDTPLSKLVLGGKMLSNAPDYFVYFLDSAEVSAVAEATQAVTREWFRKQYFRLQKNFLGFKRSDYVGPICEEDFEYTWHYCEAARAFFKKVSTTDRPVIFTFDQ